MSLQVAQSAPKHTDEAPSSGRGARRMQFLLVVAGQTQDGAEAARRRSQEEETVRRRESASAWMLVCVSQHPSLLTCLLIQTAK